MAYLLVSEAEPSPSTTSAEMGGDGGAMDAVRLRQPADAFARHVPLDQLVDLGGCQEGLSRPDLAHDHPVRSGPTALPAVGDAAERPPPHVRFHGFHGLRRVREASHHVRGAREVQNPRQDLAAALRRNTRSDGL